MKEPPLQQVLLKLKSVFPEAVTETKQTDDDGKPYYIYALKDEFIRQLQEVGLDMADDQNRYELQFPGKKTAKAATFTPCHKTLVADKEQSKNFDDTGNVFIEGDNLDALRMLQNSYRGKVKMIYIDPPYNTGNDDFVYPDDFSVKQKEYLRAAGVLDEDGVRQISEIQTGLKGRFHAGWLAFMYPRLKLARELLSDDGVIFISIDDNEQANLKLICDEIFGEQNFINLISTLINLKGNNSDFFFSGVHEYGLVYAKNISSSVTFNLLENGEDFDKWNIDNTGYWKRGGVLSASLGKTSENTNTNFPVYVTSDGKVLLERNDAGDVEVFPYSNGKKTRWYWSADTFKKKRDDIIIVRGKKGISLYSKQRMGLGDIPRKRPKTIFYEPGYGQGTNELRKIFGTPNIFTNPKAVCLLRDILYIFTTDKNDIILDFFAGSATTAHTVMQLNAEDSGNRKFILVQLPEEIKPEKSKETHQFCTKELKRPATIAEIAKERIRRAGKQIIEKSNGDMFAKDIDAGFRVFIIRDSLLNKGSDEQPLAKMEQPELKRYMIELKRENFEPLLYEALLKTGVTLNLPLVLDEIDDYPFAICDRRCYCVTENLTQQVVQGISEKHSDAFDILYYLSDALDATVSYTEIEAVIYMAPGDKQIQGLIFY